MPTLDQCKVNEILGAVQQEIDSAVAKHGPMRSRHEAYAVIAEELDEFWDEVKKNPNKNCMGEEMWKNAMREELVQVAAMAVRAILDLGLYKYLYADKVYSDMEAHP